MLAGWLADCHVLHTVCERLDSTSDEPTTQTLNPEHPRHTDTTRILLTLLRAGLAYQHAWVADLIEVAAALALYSWVGWRFRPNADNAYARLSQQEEIEMAL